MAWDVRWFGNKYFKAGVLILLPFLIYLIPEGWIFSEEHTLCLFKNITGHACYGCGITRAIVSLMHLDFSGAWYYHRAVFVVAPILFFLWSRLIWRTIQKK